MRRRRAMWLFPMSAAALVLAAGCAESLEEKSFTDRFGRVCTYVLIKETDGDKDVQDIDCDYPPRTVSPPPLPSPSPTG